MNNDPIRAALERLIELRSTDTHALLGLDWGEAFEAARAALLLADCNGGHTTPKPAPPVRRVPRKAVQLAVSRHNTIFVVADDGSTWVLPFQEGEWVELPSLPDRVEVQP